MFPHCPNSAEVGPALQVHSWPGPQSALAFSLCQSQPKSLVLVASLFPSPARGEGAGAAEGRLRGGLGAQREIFSLADTRSTCRLCLLYLREQALVSYIR